MNNLEPSFHSQRQAAQKKTPKRMENIKECVYSLLILFPTFNLRRVQTSHQNAQRQIRCEMDEKAFYLAFSQEFLHYQISQLLKKFLFLLALFSFKNKICTEWRLNVLNTFNVTQFWNARNLEFDDVIGESVLTFGRFNLGKTHSLSEFLFRITKPF